MCCVCFNLRIFYFVERDWVNMGTPLNLDRGIAGVLFVDFRHVFQSVVIIKNILIFFI